MSEEKQDFKPKELRFYRMTREGKGFAAKFQLSFKDSNKFDKWLVFLTTAPQTGVDEKGNATYGWDTDSIVVKLGENDIGELIAVLDGRKDSLGFKGSLYHETPGGGNKAVKLDFAEGSYKFSVSAQDENKNRLGPHYQTWNAAEAATLSVLLKQAIIRMYNW